MSSNKDRRDAWSVRPSADSGPPAVDLPSAPTKRTGSDSRARTIKGIAAIAVIGVGAWAAWHYGRPMYAKFRISPEIETAATNFAHALPEASANAAELQGTVTALVEDKLKSHLAKSARWYVAVGHGGEDLTVLRNDLFTPGERAFVTRVADEARAKAVPYGTDHLVYEFPLGAIVRGVQIGTDPCYVVAVWCE